MGRQSDLVPQISNQLESRTRLIPASRLDSARSSAYYFISDGQTPSHSLSFIQRYPMSSYLSTHTSLQRASLHILQTPAFSLNLCRVNGSSVLQSSATEIIICLAKAVYYPLSIPSRSMKEKLQTYTESRYTKRTIRL